jgi:hypothetical protein
MALARPVRSNYRGSVTSFRTFSTAHAGSNSLSQPPSFRIKTSLLAELNPGLPQYFVLAPIPDPCTFTLPVLVGEFLFRRKLGILSLDFHVFESLPPLRPTIVVDSLASHQWAWRKLVPFSGRRAVAEEVVTPTRYVL